MNIKKGDYQGLLNDIAIVADKDFTADQVVSIIKTMQLLGWSKSLSITMMVRRSGYLPRNIYGYILSLLEEELAEKERAFLERSSWQVENEDCASSEEFKLTMRCISLISKFQNSNKLLIKFSHYLQTAQEEGQLLETLKNSEKYYSDLIDKGYMLDPKQAGLLCADT